MTVLIYVYNFPGFSIQSFDSVNLKKNLSILISEVLNSILITTFVLKRFYKIKFNLILKKDFKRRK